MVFGKKKDRETEYKNMENEEEEDLEDETDEDSFQRERKPIQHSQPSSDNKSDRTLTPQELISMARDHLRRADTILNSLG